MGLSERKVKQKIGSDPRNLTWAENAAKFGHTYLAKHGWAPGAGLGVSGDGRISHITIAQKLDQLGIGAGRPDGPDAIAWKQAKEFEGLLERLNAANGGTGGETAEENNEDKGELEEEEAMKSAAEDEEDKQKKKEKARRKESRREEKRKAKAALLEQSNVSTLLTPTESAPVAATAPRRLAHRARFLAAKRLAGTSSTALSEILGISSTPASTSVSTPSTPATPALTAIPVLNDSNQITTSSQSVADYFKSKMRERAQTSASTTPNTTSASTPIVTFEEPDMSGAPRARLEPRPQASDPEKDDSEEEQVARPMGLGFARATANSTSLGFKHAASPPPNAITCPTSEPHILAADGAESESTKSDKEARNKKKRKRKERARAAEMPTTDENTVEDEEQVRKAAKRARKEAKRAARQREQGQSEAGESTDRPQKKQKQMAKVPAEETA